MALIGGFSSQAVAEKAWYYVWDSCALCDKNGKGFSYDEKKLKHKVNQRLFISNPVYASEHCYEGLDGAFYNKTGMNGDTSAGYSSESKVKYEINKMIRDWENSMSEYGFEAHHITLEQYPDCS